MRGRCCWRRRCLILRYKPQRSHIAATPTCRASPQRRERTIDARPERCFRLKTNLAFGKGRNSNASRWAVRRSAARCQSESSRTFRDARHRRGPPHRRIADVLVRLWSERAGASAGHGRTGGVGIVAARARVNPAGAVPHQPGLHGPDGQHASVQRRVTRHGAPVANPTATGGARPLETPKP